MKRSYKDQVLLAFSGGASQFNPRLFAFLQVLQPGFQTMPLIPLSHMLEEKITKHLQATGVTLEQFSDTADVQLPTLRRIMSRNEDGGCSLYNTFLILSQVAPEETSDLLKTYYPEFSNELDRIPVFSDGSASVEQKKDAIKKESNIVRTVFQSVHHYRIYGWILAGISRENILKKFGIDGLNILDEFVAAQVVLVLADGSIIPIIEDAVVMSLEDMKRQAQLNLELLDCSSREPWIWTRMASLNPDAITEVRSIMSEARRRIWEIMADESNSGALPMHLTMISDFVR